MKLTKKHLKWLTHTGEHITVKSGEVAPVFDFSPDINDSRIMNLWAVHFRNHYCQDSELSLLKPPNMTNSEYLITIKFPDENKSPGPSIRAGDFSEILIADYLNFVQKYYVPRTRYDRKIIGNESSKGSDVIGFKTKPDKPKKNDELAIYEVKARLSENSVENTLQNAIDGSLKDDLRLAESLNGIKQRLFDRGDIQGMKVVERFQRNIDEPYRIAYGAAAVLSETSFCSATLSQSESTTHPNASSLKILVIRGKTLMTLVHELYRRAADEA